MKYSKSWILALLSLVATPALASSSRVLDGTTITVGSPSNVLTLPQTTDTVVARATTDTLTNKSISGSTNTLTNIPVSALSTGTAIGVNTGGTGDTTLTTNGMLFGNGTSAVGITAAGSQYQVFQAGASGVPTVGALQLGQSAAVTGQLAVANGGTGLATLTSGSLLVGAGTSSPTFIASGTSGNVLTSNGSTWSSQPASSAAPTVTGTFASPSSITAAGGLTLTTPTYSNLIYIVGSPGAVTVSATPSITAGTATGQQLVVTGTSATNTVTLQDNSALSGSTLQLNGNWVAGLYSSLLLDWNGTAWVEVSRR